MNYMKSASKELGLWEVAVLSLLRQGPMHPYLMQRLLRDRHKDDVLVLKRGSLYHAIGRLERTGLIATVTTGREGRRPERTTYRITPAGEQALLDTLRRILATPRREPSQFMAAMSFLVHLTPAEALPHLAERCQRLEQEITHRETLLKPVAEKIPRIHLVESEYLLTMLKTELAWTRNLSEELRTGKLDWDIESILKQASAEARAANQEAASQETDPAEE
jgi:DNA-binding PadR family transcriptional regulator